MGDPKTIVGNAFTHSMDRPLEDSDWDTPFKELGVDSLDRVAIFLEIEKAANVSISDQSVLEEDTPNKVVRYLTDLRSRLGE